MADQRALFDRYPSLRRTLPFVPLGHFPTPVHRITDVAQALGIEHLWIKRDDISGPEYGGNKIRKLEFLLAAAREKGCTDIITFGGFGSNHALATAIYCTKLGLRCTAILTPEPATDAVRQTLRHHLALGTRLEVAHNYEDVHATADRLRAEIGRNRTYEIPFGGSSWLGATGFVNAGLELAQQVAAGALASPDRVYLACGTAGSVAGLAVGFMLGGIEATIEAVQVTPSSLKPERLLRRLFDECVAELHGREKRIPELDYGRSGIELRADQLGGGYAQPTDAARAARQLVQDLADLPVSLTYTGKALAALMADAGRGALAGQNIVFWNTYNSQPLPAFEHDDSWQALPEAFHDVFTDAWV